MNNEAQVAQAMAAIHGPQGNAYWLRERNVVCPNCLDREQRILEYRIEDTPSQRCRPHDSRYLVTVGYKSRYELLEVRCASEPIEGAHLMPAPVLPNFFIAGAPKCDESGVLNQVSAPEQFG